MHLSPTMSFTPSKPRPRSHWKKLTQLALSSFMPSAAPKTSRKPSSFTAIATKTETWTKANKPTAGRTKAIHRRLERSFDLYLLLLFVGQNRASKSHLI